MEQSPIAHLPIPRRQDEAEELFRDQVFARRAEIRLHGDVILRAEPRHSTLLIVLIACVIAALVYAATATYPRTAKASGYLAPLSGIAQVSTFRPGVVQEIFVAEGDHVTAGQPLVRLSGLATTGESIASTELAVRAIDRERDLTSAIAGFSISGLEAEMTSNAGEIFGVRRQLEAARAKLESQRNLLRSMSKQLDSIRKLKEEGYVSLIDLETRAQQVLREEAQERTFVESVVSLESRVRQLQTATRQIAARKDQATADFARQQSRLDRERAGLSGQISITLSAPIAGIISLVQYKAGETVEVGKPVVAVAPQNSPLIAEVMVPSRSIGFIRVGQEVRTAFDAFPYRHFGTMKGRVEHVSKIALSPHSIPAPIAAREPVYRVRVKIDSQQINALGEDVPLQAGMLLDATFVIERRSLLDFLLDPLRASSLSD